MGIALSYQPYAKAHPPLVRAYAFFKQFRKACPVPSMLYVTGSLDLCSAALLERFLGNWLRAILLNNPCLVSLSFIFQLIGTGRFQKPCLGSSLQQYDFFSWRLWRKGAKSARASTT
jgi:hypothetical protein